MKIIRKILIIILLVIIILLLLNVACNHDYSSIIYENENNEYALEIKEVVKKNLSILTKEEKNIYKLSELEKEGLILPKENNCNSDKSEIEITKENDKYLLEINLYCNNTYNYIKEELVDTDYCDTSKEIKEYKYKKETTKNTFDHYECSEGYELVNNTCKKEVLKTLTEEATPIYEEIINTNDAIKNEEEVLTCDFGYSLINNICEKDAYQKTSISKVCSEGYFLTEGICTKPVESSNEEETICENGLLVDGTCHVEPITKETQVIKKVVQKTQIPDEEYSYKYDAIDCSGDLCLNKTFYVYETKEYSTTKECKNGTLENDYCITTPVKEKSQKYTCDYVWSDINKCNAIGFNQIGNLCTTLPNDYEEKSISCGDGNLEESKCTKEANKNINITYYCEKGTLNGTICEEKESKIVSYKCNEGYNLDNSTCTKENIEYVYETPANIFIDTTETEYMWSSNNYEPGWIKTGEERIKEFN